MPVAVAILKNAIPAIVEERDDAALLKRLKDFPELPNFSTVNEARGYLAKLPFPSGWFDSLKEAQLYAKQEEPK
ncbi:hypothetical protein ABFZ85_13160 [Hyphococcus formosus]|uniref:hypothetical protein n=1 Tax=Hyphococcus formosus TaxID=3143534 RepID=UPI00398A7322